MFPWFLPAHSWAASHLISWSKKVVQPAGLGRPWILGLWTMKIWHNKWLNCVTWQWLLRENWGHSPKQQWLDGGWWNFRVSKHEMGHIRTCTWAIELTFGLWLAIGCYSSCFLETYSIATPKQIVQNLDTLGNAPSNVHPGNIFWESITSNR